MNQPAQIFRKKKKIYLDFEIPVCLSITFISIEFPKMKSRNNNGFWQLGVKWENIVRFAVCILHQLIFVKHQDIVSNI